MLTVWLDWGQNYIGLPRGYWRRGWACHRWIGLFTALPNSVQFLLQFILQFILQSLSRPSKRIHQERRKNIFQLCRVLFGFPLSNFLCRTKISMRLILVNGRNDTPSVTGFSTLEASNSTSRSASDCPFKKGDWQPTAATPSIKVLQERPTPLSPISQQTTSYPTASKRLNKGCSVGAHEHEQAEKQLGCNKNFQCRGVYYTLQFENSNL